MKTEPNALVTGFGTAKGHYLGLTKREHFAGLAMQGNLSMLRNMEIYDAVRLYAESKDMSVKEFVASEAVHMADLLIQELNKEPKP